MTDPENGKRKTGTLFVIERFSEWNGFHRKCPDILAEQQFALHASRKEEDMEYRKIPGTDMQLSVVVFGSWANGGWNASERTDAVRAVQASYRAGVTSVSYTHLLEPALPAPRPALDVPVPFESESSSQTR